MIYRRTRPADRIDVRKLCTENGLTFDEREPLVGFVAEDENTGADIRLRGFSFIHKAAIIDPFICKNPMAAMKLFYMSEGAISVLDLSTIVVQVNRANKSLAYELKCLGFTEVDAKYKVFKKV